MKLSLFHLFFAIAYLLPHQGFAQSGAAYLYRSAQNDFQINFPAKPEESTQQVNTEIGTLSLNLLIYDASNTGTDENLVYGLTYSDYPPEAVNSETSENLNNFFRGSIDGAVQNVQGKLLSERKIQIDQYPGREIKIDYQDGKAIIRMRFYLVESRMYILQTITETAKDNNLFISRFLESFQLIKNRNSIKQEMSRAEELTMMRNKPNQSQLPPQSTNETFRPKTSKLQSATSSKGYYLTAGVFSNQNNASRLMNSLRSQGLDAQLFFDPSNRYYYVYLGKFSTHQAADQAKASRLNGTYNGSLWIKEVR